MASYELGMDALGAQAPREPVQVEVVNDKQDAVHVHMPLWQQIALGLSTLAACVTLFGAARRNKLFS